MNLDVKKGQLDNEKRFGVGRSWVLRSYRLGCVKRGRLMGKDLVVNREAFLSVML